MLAGVLIQSKSLLISVFEEPEHMPLNQMHIGVVEMNNILVGITKFRHTHGALLAQANAVSKSFSGEHDFILLIIDFKLGGTKF